MILTYFNHFEFRKSFVKWKFSFKSLLLTTILTYFNHFEFRKSFVKWKFSFKSLLLTMILTYFNHLEFNNISEFWNVHNKHVIWNLNMDNHMINSGKKQTHKQSSLIISSKEIKKLKSPSSIL
jgi:hypothetical protein